MLLLGQIGCGGGGGAEKPLPTKVRPEVVVVPDTVEASLTGDMLNLTGQVPEGIKEGSVLVISKSPGLLRKVKAVRTSGATTVEMETEQATLEDVFEQLDVKGKKQILPEDWTVTYVAEGVTIEQGPSRQTSRDWTSAPPLRISLQDVELYKSGDITVTVSGTIELQVGVEHELRIELDGLKRFRFVPTSNVTSTLQVNATKGFEFPEIVRTVGGLNHIFLINVFPPVWVDMGLLLHVKLEGSVDAGIKAGVTVSLDGKTGADYRNGQWQPVTAADLSVTPFFDFYTAAEAEIEPQVTFYAKIMSILGPFISVSVPTINISAEVTREGITDPIPFFDIDIAVGVKAPMELRAEILGHKLANYKTEVELVKQMSLPGFPKRIHLGGTGDVIVRSPDEALPSALSGEYGRTRP